MGSYPERQYCLYLYKLGLQIRVCKWNLIFLFPNLNNNVMWPVWSAKCIIQLILFTLLSRWRVCNVNPVPGHLFRPLSPPSCGYSKEPSQWVLLSTWNVWSNWWVRNYQQLYIKILCFFVHILSTSINCVFSSQGSVDTALNSGFPQIFKNTIPWFFHDFPWSTMWFPWLFNAWPPTSPFRASSLRWA